MKAGPRKHLVRIMEPIESVTGSGDTTASWKEWDKRYAKIRQPNAREVEENRQVGLNISHLVDMPFVPGLTAKMRLEIDNHVLNIVRITDPDFRGIEHRLECIERV